MSNVEARRDHLQISPSDCGVLRPVHSQLSLLQPTVIAGDQSFWRPLGTAAVLSETEEQYTHQLRRYSGTETFLILDFNECSSASPIACNVNV